MPHESNTPIKKKKQAAEAGRRLAHAVAIDADSKKNRDKSNKDAEQMAAVVPLLVWLMRLIVQSRVTASDSHLSGLLSLACVLIRRLGSHGKREVGLWGLQKIAVDGVAGAALATVSGERGEQEAGDVTTAAAAAVAVEGSGGRSAGEGRVGGEGEEEAKDAVVGRNVGLLYYVYHDCLFEIATSWNHGPLAPPKCRSVCVSVYACVFFSSVQCLVSEGRGGVNVEMFLTCTNNAP